MNNKVILILIFALCISFVSAQLSYSNPTLPKLNAPVSSNSNSNSNINTSSNITYLEQFFLRLNGGNSPTANINWNFFGIFNVGDSNFTNDVSIDNQLTLGTGTSNLEISYTSTNLFNTTGKNALFTENLTASNLFSDNICYSNGTGCLPSADFTNVAFLNNTQTFIANQSINGTLNINDDSNLSLIVKNISSDVPLFHVNNKDRVVSINKLKIGSGSSSPALYVENSALTGNHINTVEIYSNWTSTSVPGAVRSIYAAADYDGNFAFPSPGAISLFFNMQDFRNINTAGSGDDIRPIYVNYNRGGSSNDYTSTKSAPKIEMLTLAKSDNTFANFTGNIVTYTDTFIGTGLSQGASTSQFNWNGSNSFTHNFRGVNIANNFAPTISGSGAYRLNGRMFSASGTGTTTGDSLMVAYYTDIQGFDKTWNIVNEGVNTTNPTNNYLGGTNVKNYRGLASGSIANRNLSGVVFDMYNGTDWIFSTDNTTSTKIHFYNVSEVKIANNFSSNGTGIYLTNLPTGSTGADTDYLCINITNGRVFRNETGC